MQTGETLLSQIHPRLETLVRKTGAWIRGEADKFQTSQIEYKGKNNLVSYVDLTAEKMLVEGCQNLIPGSGFINEEGGETASGNDYRWIIDPLDGTTNFTHGVPAYSISLALQERNHTVLGLVYDIVQEEMFS